MKDIQQIKENILRDLKKNPWFGEMAPVREALICFVQEHLEIF